MRNKKLMLFIIAANIIWLLLFIPLSGPIMFSPMLFDAPGSMSSPFTLMLFFSIWSYIPAVFISIAGSWIFYFCKKNRLSVAFTVLPLISIISGITAFLMIIFVAGGSLVWN